MAAEAAEATAQVMATEGARAAPAAMEVEREVDRVAAAVVVVEWGEGMDVAVLEENAVEYLEEWGGSWVWPYRQSLRDRQPVKIGRICEEKSPGSARDNRTSRPWPAARTTAHPDPVPLSQFTHEPDPCHTRSRAGVEPGAYRYTPAAGRIAAGCAAAPLSPSLSLARYCRSRSRALWLALIRCLAL